MLLLLFPFGAAAAQDRSFSLSASSVFYDSSDAEVVGIAARMLAEDISKVSGKQSRADDGTPSGRNVIIIGTIEGNKYIASLVKKGVIDVEAIRGGWERYSYRFLRHPSAGVNNALVIVGSDRRGAAYGAMDISRRIGVSPWLWWADVPVRQNPSLSIEACNFDSKAPSVKYRGIFINDEDWGLLPWASKTFDPEFGNIGPKTYERVYSLMLRLKANYLSPAMHRRSTAFNAIDQNKVLADRYGIVMGSTHCEPLLYNNASEWDKKTMGPWNYETNKETILRVLNDRVKSNCKYENVYTVALRGLHDKAMEANPDMEERKKLLQGAIDDQREILSRHTGLSPEEIPQIFIPYKEVLDIYNRGMEVPGDVTLVWPDDNYGYMKQVSNPREQKRTGRSGVYYHVSYHGKPHDYLWFSTTPPALMYEELDKVYRSGGDRLWVVNAGDIKFCEYSVDLFLRMAFDFEAFDFETVNADQPRWLCSIFGGRYAEDFDFIVKEFYRLAFSSKPEYMGWGQEWNRVRDKIEKVTDTDYSLTSYNEADTRLGDYARLTAVADSVYNSLPESDKAAFYELILYPVLGSHYMNRMHLSAQKARAYALEGRASATIAAEECAAAYDSLVAITSRYNGLCGGKWMEVASLRHGVTATYFKKPSLPSVRTLPYPCLGIRAEGQELTRGGKAFCALPVFSRYLQDESHWIDIFNRGCGSLKWHLDGLPSWLSADTLSGETELECRVSFSVDWSAAPKGESIPATFRVVSSAGSREVLVSLFNPAEPSSLKGLFVENEGVVSIPAAEYSRSVEVGGVSIRKVEGLSAHGGAVILGDPLGNPQNVRDSSSFVEYDFYTFNSGSVDVYTYALPTFLPYARGEFGKEFAGQDPADGNQRFALMIDGVIMMCPEIPSAEYSQSWSENVLRNSSVRKTTMNIAAPGKHSIRVMCADQGVVLQKIVIDLGGLHRSLLGPPSTFCSEGDVHAGVSGPAHPATLGGILGERIEKCFNGRLSHFITGPGSPAVALFGKDSLGTKSGSWRGEHVGKWLYAASLAYERTRDATLGRTLASVADHMLSLQEDDGYLGCYNPQIRFTSSGSGPGWDLWINTYMMQGLTEASVALGKKEYLDAACRIADLMFNTFVTGGQSIADTGHHSGMVGLGSLSPLVDLYALRREPRYRELIGKCLEEMESTPGLKLLSRTFAREDVALIGDGKIYEMLRCLTGIAKLCSLEENPSLLASCVNAWENIRNHHLTPCGGPWGGINVNAECFNREECFDISTVTETCSSMEWMHLTHELLKLTANGIYAEELEKTAYNALLGAGNPDGERWVYYTRLNGEVYPGDEWSCCWSSGMIAMEELPGMIFSTAGECRYVNIYSEASDEVLEIHTAYPSDGKVTVCLKDNYDGKIALRLPAWASELRFSINGKNTGYENCRSFAVFDRQWCKGDKIEFTIPMEFRQITAISRYINDGKFSTRLNKTPKRYRVRAKGPFVYSGQQPFCATAGETQRTIWEEL